MDCFGGLGPRIAGQLELTALGLIRSFLARCEALTFPALEEAVTKLAVSRQFPVFTRAGCRDHQGRRPAGIGRGKWISEIACG